MYCAMARDCMAPVRLLAGDIESKVREAIDLRIPGAVVERLWVVGSRPLQECRPHSDIDVMVKLKPIPGKFADKLTNDLVHWMADNEMRQVCTDKDHCFTLDVILTYADPCVPFEEL